MSRPRIIHVTSIEQLRQCAAAWDDLWLRSDVTMPTVRAEPLARWIEQFAPGADFHALAVEHRGQWVAALPLVHRRLGRMIDAGTWPSNEWSVGGELLLCSDAETGPVLDVLAAAIGELPWQLVWLDEAPLDAPRWEALLGAVDRAALATCRHEQLQIGRIEVGHDWQAYRSSWSRRHRQAMARHARRLAAQGDVQLKFLSQFAPHEVEPCLRRGFEVEDRGWKGKAGTSVLRAPGMFEFFVGQAELLAAWGNLALAFLELDGRPIAFAYGLGAKGVYHSIKVGYDPEYAACSPGQLLRYYLLQRLFDDPKWRAVDYLPPSDAHRKWKPATRTLSRLVIAPRRWLGRVVLRAYRTFRPGARCRQKMVD